MSVQMVERIVDQLRCKLITGLFSLCVRFVCGTVYTVYINIYVCVLFAVCHGNCFYTNPLSY